MFIPATERRDLDDGRPRSARAGDAARRAGADDRPWSPPRVVAARRTLFRAGETADRIYELVDGLVLITRPVADGRCPIVDMVGPGRLFGCASGPDHTTTALTAVASTFRQIDRDEVERSPAVRAAIHARLLGEMELAHDRAVLLGRRSAMERVAGFLRDHAGPSTRAVVRMPVSRQEMADYLGLTIETVSRKLGCLRRSRIVAVERVEAIRVLDDARLAAAAEGALERCPGAKSSTRSTTI